MQRIVLSGVNFVEGGPLAVFKDALEAIAKEWGGEKEIIALVHRRNLFNIANVTYKEFPDVKTSWLKRVRFEYFECKKLSRELNADLWFCMHDMTATVVARRRAVYCHNPAPFYQMRWRDVWLDPRFAVFRLFYSLLYRINLAQNDAIVVQQQWMRSEFEQRYEARGVVVAHPSVAPATNKLADNEPVSRSATIFFYPAFPRCFKNIECLLEAAGELARKQAGPFEVWITIRGDENRYAKWLYKKFHANPSVRWLGPLTRERVAEIYPQTDCLVFPSRLETWGLPLSEFRLSDKPILAAERNYAHETLSGYSHAQYFRDDLSHDLAGRMEDFLRGTLTCRPPDVTQIAKPFVSDWPALFEYLLALPERPAQGRS